jgi:hypothetical protein
MRLQWNTSNITSPLVVLIIMVRRCCSKQLISEENTIKRDWVQIGKWTLKRNLLEDYLLINKPHNTYGTFKTYTTNGCEVVGGVRFIKCRHGHRIKIGCNGRRRSISQHVIIDYSGMSKLLLFLDGYKVRRRCESFYQYRGSLGVWSFPTRRRKYFSISGWRIPWWCSWTTSRKLHSMEILQ